MKTLGLIALALADFYAIRDEKNYQNTLSLTERNQKLLKASEDGQTNRLRIAVETGADVDHTDSAHETALHKAARGGHDDCVTLLFELGADVNYLNKDGKTPLNLALERHHDSVVGFLMQQRGTLGLCSITQFDSSGRTPLYLAASDGRVSSCEALIQAGANVNTGKGRHTPLMEATSNGHERVVNLLICAGAKLDERDSQGETALLYAVLSRNLSICEILLDAGANMDLRTPEAPLLTASRTGQEMIFNLLVHRGADVNVQDRNGWTPLHHAAKLGNMAACEMLLASNASIELAAMVDGELYPPRRLAKMHGHMKVVAFLETKGARKGHWYGAYTGQKRLRQKSSFHSSGNRPPSELPIVRQPIYERASRHSDYGMSKVGAFDSSSAVKSRNGWPAVVRDAPNVTLPPLSTGTNDIGTARQLWECDECEEACVRNQLYHCNLCSNGDYDVCKPCVTRGAWCPDLDHCLYDELGGSIHAKPDSNLSSVGEHIKSTSQTAVPFPCDDTDEHFLIQQTLEKSSLNDEEDQAILQGVLNRSKTIR